MLIKHVFENNISEYNIIGIWKIFGELQNKYYNFYSFTVAHSSN